MSLQGCSTLGGQGGLNDKLAIQEKLDENLGAADKALKQGQTEQALAHLDAAAKVDPSAKQPWLKKSQIHFEARQYGLAITEAQEVLQRDVNDLTAKSILAVSGLRVSAQALEQLRKVNEVNGSARSEAESVARIIHEALGEPILVGPAPALVPVEPPPKPRVARSVSRPAVPATAPTSGSSVPAANTTVAARPAPATGNRPAPATNGRANPFGALQ